MSIYTYTRKVIKVMKSLMFMKVNDFFNIGIFL